MNDSELFDRYLQNRLSTKEKELFEKRLQQDPEFADRFRIFREIDWAIIQTDMGDFREQLEEIQGQNPELTAQAPVMGISRSLQNELDEAIRQQDVMALRKQLDQIHSILEGKDAFAEDIPGFRRIERAINKMNGIQLQEELELLKQKKAQMAGLTDGERLDLEIDQAIQESDVMNFRDQLKRIAKEEPSLRKLVPERRRWIRNISAAAAAILILALATSYFMGGMSGTLSPQKAAYKLYQPYQAKGVTRGAYDLKSTDYYESAMKQYREKDFEGAYDILHLVPSPDHNVIFYLGMTAYMINRTTESEEYFNQYLQTGENAYRESARFYLTGCYLRKGEADRARKQLEGIAAEPRNSYAEKAKNILKKTSF